MYEESLKYLCKLRLGLNQEVKEEDIFLDKNKDLCKDEKSIICEFKVNDLVCDELCLQESKEAILKLLKTSDNCKESTILSLIVKSYRKGYEDALSDLKSGHVKKV